MLHMEKINNTRPSVSMIQRLMKKIEEISSVENFPKSSRPSIKSRQKIFNILSQTFGIHPSVV